MGKRWQNAIALILIVGSLAGGYIARNANSDQVIQKFQGPVARAQELNPDRTLALTAKSGFVGDAIAEQPIILQDLEGADKNIRVWVTAYTNDPSETKDYDIGITAMGTKTRDGVAAANFLPFGTKFMLPEVYGDKVFTVEDRMNSRYDNQRIVDIWMPVKKSARIFGKQALTMELL